MGSTVCEVLRDTILLQTGGWLSWIFIYFFFNIDAKKNLYKFLNLIK